MRLDPGNEIYEMLHNGTKYTRGTTNESAWPFRRLRCHSSHCLPERRFWLESGSSNDVEGGTTRVEARSAKRPR